MRALRDAAVDGRDFITVQFPQTRSEVKEKQAIRSRSLDLECITGWLYDPEYTESLPIIAVEMPCPSLIIYIFEGESENSIVLYGEQATQVKEFFESRWTIAWFDLDGKMINVG